MHWGHGSQRPKKLEEMYVIGISSGVGVRYGYFMELSILNYLAAFCHIIQ